ncbi:thermonuclease family protein [Aquisediminimonas profunda]|uniref:thermonuclease family protein n=1 Tax=Aquisediminimonas profunda TaxID=1550733 RepID=UPI001FEC5576|nr:thermonuclease family protein [Aquisediminimonas profunda]
MPVWRGFGLPIGKAEWAGTVLCGILAGLCIGFALLIWAPHDGNDRRIGGRAVAATSPQKWVVADMDTGRPAPVSTRETTADNFDQVASTQGVTVFGLCHIGGGTNCVVDGDTIWMDGVKIRVADIDAPETHPPRCAAEADLGNRATLRLQQLLNAGPITLEQIGRDEDRYGRKLRILVRQGRSLGDILVSEGLARTYQGGPRTGWC